MSTTPNKNTNLYIDNSSIYPQGQDVNQQHAVPNSTYFDKQQALQQYAVPNSTAIFNTLSASGTNSSYYTGVNYQSLTTLETLNERLNFLESYFKLLLTELGEIKDKINKIVPKEEN